MDSYKTAEIPKKEKLENERAKYQIAKKNDLIQTAAFGLKSQEYDLLNFTIMKIKPEDTELKPIRINIREYCRVAGINENDNYANIKKAAKGLADKSVWADIVDANGKLVKSKLVRWIEDPEIEKGEITIQLKPYWAPYLLDLKERYTTLLLHETLPMKSIYGKRTYELLKSYMMNRKGPVVITFEISEYRRIIFGIMEQNKKYPEFSNFKRRVLDRAMEDLREYGGLDVHYKLRKEGYNYKYIDFIVEARDLDDLLEVYKRERLHFEKNDRSLKLSRNAHKPDTRR